MNKRESYRTKRNEKGKMKWVPMSKFVASLEDDVFWFQKRRRK